MKQGRKPTRDEKELLTKVKLDWTEYQTLGYEENDTRVKFQNKKDNTTVSVDIKNRRKPTIIN